MLNLIIWNKTVLTLTLCIAQLAAEYTDCTSAEAYDTPPPTRESPGYYTEQSDGEIPVILEL